MPKSRPGGNKKTRSKKKQSSSNPLIVYWSKLSAKPKKIKLPVYFGLALLGLIVIHNLVEFSFRPVKNPNYGVSFSIKYAQELGVNWRANYVALLDDLKLRNYRLMSYWDSIEPENNRYTFEDLDWQFAEADKRGAKVSLAIGLRQPRWPECHEPGWSKQLEIESDAWRQELYSYIETVVKRYKDHPALVSYQLENEAVNSWFGDCRGGPAEKDRLNQEFSLIKSLDSKHPVWMSLSDQHGFPAGSPTPDRYGYSVYRIVWNDKGPINFYVTYPTPVWYHRLRAAAINLFKDRDIFIHELQIEPWGPMPTKELSIEEQERSMSAKQINTNFEFAKKIGTEDIYTWGAEWWYWRKSVLNDDRPWQTVKTEFSKYQP